MKNPKWKGLAINGGVSLSIGLIFIFTDQVILWTIIKILGVVLAISGIGILLFSFYNHKSKGSLNIYYLAQGILNLALGAIMIFRPVITVDFIVFAIGVWAIAIGVFQIIYALKVRKIVNSGMFLLANGIIFMGLGLMMLIDPETVIKTMLTIIGSIISLLGVILLFFSYKVYQLNKTVDYEELSSESLS